MICNNFNKCIIFPHNQFKSRMLAWGTFMCTCTCRMVMGGGGLVRGQRLARCYMYVRFSTVWECSNGRKCYVLNLRNNEYREKNILLYSRAWWTSIYICENIIIIKQLKNNFRTRSLWPCHRSGGRCLSANKLTIIKNTGI